MKRFFPLMAALGLAACAGSQTPAAAESADASMPAVGMANPASVYCVQQGGKS